MVNGKPDKMIRPVNGDAQYCGIINEGGKDLTAFTKLYYIFKHDDMTPRAVCVEKCPKDIISPVKCHGTEKITPDVCENEYS